MNRLRKRQGQIEWLLLIFVLAVALFFVWHYVDYTLDSDAASELVFCKHLADEGVLISEDWCYSTEIRVFSTHLVYTPLFKLFSDWHTVRCVGTTILLLIMLASLCCYCRASDASRFFPLYAMLLLLPISPTLYKYTVKFAYYTPYYSVMLMVFALGLLALTEQSRPRLWLFAVGGAILSLLAGLGGFRLVFNIHVVLLMSALLYLLLERELRSPFAKRLTLLTLLFTLVAFAGLAVNVLLLAPRYSFFDQSAMELQSFSLQGIQNVIAGLTETYGFPNKQPLLSSALLYATLGLGAFTLSIYCSIMILKRREAFTAVQRLATCFYLCSVLSLCLIFTFVHMYYHESYLFCAAFLGFAPVFIYLGSTELCGRAGRVVLLSLCSLALICGLLSYNDMRKQDTTSELREVSDFLVSKGYHNGYATFWNANVLTELSDGEIEVWAWYGDFGKLEDLDYVNDWLQLKAHVDAPPAGKLFVLLSAHEYNLGLYTQNLEDYPPVFTSSRFDAENGEGYMIFFFEDYESMIAEFMEESA